MSDVRHSLNDIWADAARQFQEICGESLLRGDVKSFDDVRRKIEAVNKVPDGDGSEQEDKWDKARSAGLQSLKYMKMLLGAASQAASLIPVPGVAANMAGSALSFVFDIPEKVKGYNDAIDSVFTDVSSALAQFQIYQSIDEGMHHELLVQQIHLVLVSIVKLCAHVVKHRQGRRRDRLKRHLANIFDDNRPLDAEMTEFHRVLQAQRDVEGTVTLSVLVETRSDVAELLDRSAVFGKTLEETHQGVQSLKDDNDRTRTLTKIRNTLQVPAIVLLDTRTTQTCTNIAAKALPETGSWIWEDEAYVSWTEGTARVGLSNVLVISGPPASGKTLATAQIVKRLEEEKGRTYVAHYFFPPANAKKDGGDDSKHPVHSALRYMAFQIARVDATVRKALGKACESGHAPLVLTRNSPSSLDSLWSELKIGVPGSGATYYLVFEGIENLDEKDREMLLDFTLNPKLAKDAAGRVRLLVSGTTKTFDTTGAVLNALRIDMERYNGSDMRAFIEERLNKQSLLRHAKPGSLQQKARDNMLAKLPQKAAGSYSQLQFALDEIVRLLSSRTSFEELDRVLDHAMNSHETAIKALQRSLSVEEISEVNELLKWVHFSNERLNVAELEAAMFLYTGTESLGLLSDIITSKYSAVLKIDDSPGGPFVDIQDGALEYLQKEKEHKSQQSKDRPTISMTINITNADQEIVGHFLWDLAQKAIRDQFRFNFDSASNTLHTRQSIVAVDEFEAHHTIVMRALKYLSGDPSGETDAIGPHLFLWLPYHLASLSRLEDEDKGSLMPDEHHEIGQHLYQLFKDAEMFKRHKAMVALQYWSAAEMEDVKKWLVNPAVVRRLPKQWRDEVYRAPSPVKGYFKHIAREIIEDWLRNRERMTLGTQWGYRIWIREFMAVEDDNVPQLPQTPKLPNDETASTDQSSSESPAVDWDRVSDWCQTFLGLPESDLDALWWDRIARVAQMESIDNPEVVLSLFRRALEKENPSWLTNGDIADRYSELDRSPEAITEAEVALKRMRDEGSWPTPEEDDIMRLNYKLGGFHLELGNTQQAAEQYLLVSKSSNKEWAERGQVSHLEAILSSDDSEGAKDTLRKALSGNEESDESMVRVLKMIARNINHNLTISKMFTVAKDDKNLWQDLVSAIEKASDPPASADYAASEMSESDRYAEKEAQGVLLYHRGMTVAYRLSPEDAHAIDKSLLFWQQCRDQLSGVAGLVAATTRTNATAELAKYYFHRLTKDQGPPEHIEALSRLVDEDTSLEGDDPIGYLTAVYALRDDKEKARAIISRRIKTALEILSDDRPENDFLGYQALFKCLAHYRDFDNCAAALTFLGAVDLTTGALRSTVDDVKEEDGIDKSRVVELLGDMSKSILPEVKTQVPDSSQQPRRIEIAMDQIKALASAGDPADKERAVALALLNSRISALQEPQAMKEALEYYWYCDGLGLPGTVCDRRADFDTEFWHCVYCANRDFCPDCLQKLRDPSTQAMQCSADHAWIKIPRQGSDLFRGLRAKSVRVPVVRPVEGDESLWEAYYPKDEVARELTLGEWTAGLAKEWEISLDIDI